MEDTKNMTLGKRILYYRKRMTMTQDQLAERMGVSPQAVSKWEHDLSCPDVTSLPRLAEIFGITTDELLGITSAQPQSAKTDIFDGDDEDEVTDSGQSVPSLWKTLRRYSGRYLWALFLIALGGIYLTADLLELNTDFWDILWSLSILFFGIHWSLHNLLPLGGLCILGGGYLLLENLGLVEEHLVTWPLLLGLALVLCGLSILLKRYLRPKGHQCRSTSHYATSCTSSCSERPTRVCDTSGGSIRADFAFCSDRVTIHEELFRGGSIDVAFGSLVLDLRNCSGATADCELKLDVSFGSLVLLLPGHLRVDLDLDRMGASCDTTGMPEADATPILLYGDCAFSSLKLQYT